MNLRKITEDVYLAPGPITRIGAEEIEFLKKQVVKSKRGRIRINMHNCSDDLLHEMFIAILPSSYIHPHRHPGKSESFHVLHGSVDIVVFNEVGDIIDVIMLGALHMSKSVYYRMSNAFFHSLIIRSDVLIVHEITNGPFIDGATEFAAFAPSEKSKNEVNNYINSLNSRVDYYLGKMK